MKYIQQLQAHMENTFGRAMVEGCWRNVKNINGEEKEVMNRWIKYFQRVFQTTESQLKEIELGRRSKNGRTDRSNKMDQKW